MLWIVWLSYHYVPHNYTFWIILWDFWPHGSQEVHIDPEVFDYILDQISSNPIFNSGSNNLQVAVQLAIFLNPTGHYGNAMILKFMYILEAKSEVVEDSL